MIDPKEIRIGNLLIEEDGCVAKIIGMKPYDHSVRCDEAEGCDLLVDVYEADGIMALGCLSDSNKSRPIGLTSEWLAKLGFEQEKSNDSEERDIWSIQVANNTSLYYDPELPGKEWYLSLEWNNNHWQNEFWATPKSVHQVQNLYYALTSEELTIKSFNQSN